MKEAIEIGWFQLFAGYALFLVPIYLLWYFKTGLLRASVIACLRMTLQLILVGYYLEFIFKWNNIILNILWLFIMTIIGASTISKRSGLNKRIFIVPIFVGLFTSVAIVNLYLLFAVIQPKALFDAQYLIPISGMLLGNSMRHNIVALTNFYDSFENGKSLYFYLLGNGASKLEALLPFWKSSLKLSINPAIAQMAVMGLISLPGMMTGQILGGNLPSTAIKYQILIILATFFLAVTSIAISISISNTLLLNSDGTLKGVKVFTSKTKKGKKNSKQIVG